MKLSHFPVDLPMLNNSDVILGSTQIRYENRQRFKCRSFHVSNRRDWVQYLSDHYHFTAWNGFKTFDVVHTTTIQFIKDTHYQDLKWKCPTMIWKCPPGSFWHNINILLPYCHIHPKVSHSESFPPRFFECLQLKKVSLKHLSVTWQGAIDKRFASTGS